MQTDRLRDSQRAARAARAEKVQELEQIAAAAERGKRSTLTSDEDARFQTLRGEIEQLDADLDSFAVELAESLSREQRAAAAAGVPTSFGLGRDFSRLDAVERSAIQRVETSRSIPDGGKERLVELLERDADPQHALAHWTMVTSEPDYASAFAKVLRDPVRGHLDFAGGEIDAWNAVRRLERSLVVGTNTSGGFLVPTHLDPSIILSNSGSASPMRRICRTATIATSTWHGVSSAGVTASWDGELVAVSDDSPTVGQVEIATHKGAAFIGASIEAFEDTDAAMQVATLFADARDRLEASGFATGAGTGEPLGIWTALDANTNVELVSTTAATIGLVDLQSTYRALPVRWRSKATWVMNPLYLTAIQALGTAVSASFTTTASDLPERLLTKPIEPDDYAPSTQTTTVRDNEIVLGDFSQYLIVDRVGFRVEYVPHLFDVSTGLPRGERGWYGYWRTGGAPLVDDAFRLLQNKTSA